MHFDSKAKQKPMYFLQTKKHLLLSNQDGQIQEI